METLKNKAAQKVIQTYKIPDDLLGFLINKFYVYVPLLYNKHGGYYISHEFCYVVYSSLEKAQERMKILTKSSKKSLDIIYMKYPLDPRYPYDKIWILLLEAIPLLITNDEDLYNVNKELFSLVRNIDADECCYKIDDERDFHISYTYDFCC